MFCHLSLDLLFMKKCIEKYLFLKCKALVSLQILSEDQCQDFLVARVNSQTFKISEKYLKGKFPPFPVGQKK